MYNIFLNIIACFMDLRTGLSGIVIDFRLRNDCCEANHSVDNIFTITGVIFICFALR